MPARGPDHHPGGVCARPHPVSLGAWSGEDRLAPRDPHLYRPVGTDLRVPSSSTSGQSVRTIDEALCGAPPDLAFQVAADVESWPRILPHYRWVRFQRRDGFASGLVEMAAWRPFGPLRYPTWWVSEMEHDAPGRVVRYRHVRGVTRGMDVLWEVAPHGQGSRLRIVHEWKGPSWPLAGSVAANMVIGPFFISHIAGRTLAGVAAEAERRHGVGS